jgi:hypothetical protein
VSIYLFVMLDNKQPVISKVSSPGELSLINYFIEELTTILLSIKLDAAKNRIQF